jgi:hypothetical protein
VSDIFREVDEDLRRENAAKLWKKYGGVVIGIAALIVFAVAGFVAWEEWQRRARAADSATYLAAIDLARDNRTDEAIAAFGGLATGGTAGYAVLSRLAEAGLRAEIGDGDGARAAYLAVADDRGTPRVYRDLAALLWAMHGLENEGPDRLIERLRPLAAHDSPWRHSARELLALAYVRAGDRERAREVLTELTADPYAPGSARERATEMLEVLG